MTTAIVVVSFEGAKYLPGCLAGCRDDGGDTRVIVVDNASKDGSADVAARELPDATVVRLDANAGFAGGCNVGIALAFAGGADYVFLLNQDAHISEGTVGRLVAFLDAHPRAAAVQAGVFLPDGRVNTLGNSVNYLGFGSAGGNGLTVAEARRQLPWLQKPGAWEEGAEVPSASGAALMLRASALAEVGLFEEELFTYHEDFELCLRLRSRGWTIHVLPAVEVVHHYDFARNPAKFYYLERNRYWVWLAHLKLRTLLLLAIPILAAEAAVWAQALGGGWSREKLRSWTYWLDPQKGHYLRRRRRDLQASRRLSDRALLEPATGGIDSADVGGALVGAVMPLSAAAWRRIYRLIRW